MNKSKNQNIALILIIAQVISLLIYSFVGRAHEIHMMKVLPLLAFEERLGVFALIITGFFLVFKNKFFIGFFTVVVADFLILANQMSINEGHLINILISFWDAALLAAMRVIERRHHS